MALVCRTLARCERQHLAIVARPLLHPHGIRRQSIPWLAGVFVFAGQFVKDESPARKPQTGLHLDLLRGRSACRVATLLRAGHVQKDRTIPPVWAGDAQVGVGSAAVGRCLRQVAVKVLHWIDLL